MLRFPEDLSKAKILITNDDSIHSDGIKVLEKVARSFSDQVWVVAPETQQSAAGHSLTIHKPLRIKSYDDAHHSVLGTPTDSVLLGVEHILKEFRPDIILSGVNHGQNAADDVTYSGTIAAAIEGTLLGIPSLAFSQDCEMWAGDDDWEIVEEYLPKILTKLQGFSWNDNVLLNINFPVELDENEMGIAVVSQGHYGAVNDGLVECLDPRGRPYFWIGPPPKAKNLYADTDIGALKSGRITITPLSLNLTDEKTLNLLSEVFS